MTYRNLDTRLIRALQRDARRSLRSLAHELSVAPSTVGHRLDDLVDKGVIRGFKPDLDYAKLGMGLVAVTKIKARGDALPAIVQALAKIRMHLIFVMNLIFLKTSYVPNYMKK